MTKLYPLPGFERFDIGRVGHWCPVNTGCTYGTLYDCNPSTSNHGTLTNFANLNTGWAGSQFGTVLDFDGIDDFVNCGNIVGFPQNNWTIESWALTRANSQRGIIATGTNTGTRSQIHMFFFNSTTLAFRLVNDDLDISGLPNMLNKMQHVVWTFDANNFGTIYLNGIRIGSKQYGGAFVGTTDFFLGRGQSSSNRLLDGQIASQLLYNRSLSPAEVLELYRIGPGGMWTTEPPSRRYATLLANAYTLIAASASYSITGQPVGLLAGRLLTADAASYLLAGNSTGLNAGRMLTADSAAYTLTGQDANLLASRLLSGDTATYNLVGNAANLLASRVLVANQSQYGIASQDANLIASRLLQANSAQYDLSAQAVSLLSNRMLQANSAQYTVTGSDAALLAGRLLDCGSSAFLLSPNQAGLLAARKLTADQASILLSTQATSLYAGRKITADTAQFILIASPVDLTFAGGGAAPYYYLFLLGGSR